MGAWEMTAGEILGLPDASAPELIFYDDSCVYTTAESDSAPAGRWRTFPHGGSIPLPDGSTVPVQLMSFANEAPGRGPFFVMAAPAFWAAHGNIDELGVTGVFLHEFTHTRQIAGVGEVIGPIDETWPFEEELSDDSLQKRFESDPEYVAAWTAERDALYRAAEAGTPAEARNHAAEALRLMRSRHERWLTGEHAVFATLDDVFLSMEGAAQWTAVAWLSHPEGGRLSRDEAIAKMLGRRRWWSQDQGLALFLTLERLLPVWPSLVFRQPSAGAVELLELAVGGGGGGR